MGWFDKLLKRNTENIAVSQYFNDTADDYEIVKGANGAFNVQLTGRKVTLSTSDFSQVLNINPSGSALITITPPVGELWRIKLLRIYVAPPTGATTGTNTFRVYEGGNTSDFMILSAISAYNVGSALQANVFNGTYTAKIPTTDSDVQRAILNLQASNQCPLYIYIANGTDVIQNQQALIKLVKEIEYIV